MKETLPTTPTAPAERPEQLDQGEYSEADLEQLGAAARGAEDVLEQAVAAGEPRSKVVETDRGPKGFVESAVPGGRVEGMFDGTGEGARLEEVHISLNNDHEIGVEFKEGGQTLIFVDGEPARPEDVPAVAAVINHMKAEQAGEDDNSDEKDGERSQEIVDEAADVESMPAKLDDIDKRLQDAHEKLQDISAELKDLSEAMGDAFERLADMIAEIGALINKALNEMAKEEDEEKRKEIVKDLNKKIESVTARLASR